MRWLTYYCRKPWDCYFGDIFFCSSKPRTLTTKQPLAGNDTLYLYVHNIACIRLIYKFEFMYGMHMFLAYKGCFFIAEQNGHPVRLKTPKKISKKFITYITYNFIPKKQDLKLRKLHPFRGVFQLTTFLSCPRQTSAKESEKSSVKLSDLKNPKEAMVIRYSSSIFGTWIFWWNGFYVGDCTILSFFSCRDLFHGRLPGYSKTVKPPKH